MKFQIGAHTPTTQDAILSSICSWIYAGLYWFSPVFSLFCLQLTPWYNCDWINTRSYNRKNTNVGCVAIIVEMPDMYWWCKTIKDVSYESWL